jgi:hypothetical protein
MGDKLRETVFQAIGQASMKWNPRPTGVFDSTEASKVADKLIFDIKSLQEDELKLALAHQELEDFAKFRKSLKEGLPEKAERDDPEVRDSYNHGWVSGFNKCLEEVKERFGI